MWCAYHAAARDLINDPGASTRDLHAHRSCLAGRDFAVLDLEGTSADPLTARIIEVGIVLVSEDGTLGERRQWLVNPGVVFGPNVHGLSPEDVAGSPEFVGIASIVHGLLAGRVLVAHEAHYDVTLLGRELALAGYELDSPAVCTRENLPSLQIGTRALIAVCAELGIPHPHPHRALPDAEATAALLGHYLDRARVEGQPLLLPHGGCARP